jgi:hypothetical protein
VRRGEVEVQQPRPVVQSLEELHGSLGEDLGVVAQIVMLHFVLEEVVVAVVVDLGVVETAAELPKNSSQPTRVGLNHGR